MKTKQPLTDMSGRWVLSTFEAFDTLLSRGYVAASPGSYSRKTKYLVIDNEGIHRYSDEVSLSSGFSEAYYHKGHFYDEPQDDTITEDKVPFPELKDVEHFIEPNQIKRLAAGLGSFLDGISVNEYIYNEMKIAYKTGIEVTWKPKQTDPHADLKAKYEEALKVHDVVRVFWKQPIQGVNDWQKVPTGEPFNNYEGIEYQLRFYNIDFNKLLECSYRDGEFVECEFSDIPDSFNNIGELYAMFDNSIYKFYSSNNADLARYKYCRLAPNVTIQDEWLVEVKL